MKYIRKEVLRPEEQQEMLEMRMRGKLEDRYVISESRAFPISLLELVGENGMTLSSQV